MGDKSKKKFYKTNWFMWVTLVLFSPVGIFVMWKYNKFSKPTTRIVVTVLFILYFAAQVSQNFDSIKSAEDKTMMTTAQKSTITNGENQESKEDEGEEAKVKADAEAKVEDEANKIKYAGMGISREEVQQILANLNYDFKFEDNSKGNEVPVVIGKLNNYPIMITLSGYSDNLKSIGIMYGLNGSYLTNPNEVDDEVIKKCIRIEMDLLKNIFLDKDLGKDASVWSTTSYTYIKNDNLGPFDKLFGNWNIDCIYTIKDNAVIKLVTISSKDLDELKNLQGNTVNTNKQDISYKKYANERYGFSIEYPDNFKVKVIPNNGDGIILQSQDEKAELTISGINNVLGNTAVSEYNELLSQHNAASYKIQKNNWFILSWIEDDKIVYQKTVVGSGSENSFIIKYPTSQKDYYNPIVSHFVDTFESPGIESSH